MLPLLKMYAFIPIYTQKVLNQNKAIFQIGFFAECGGLEGW
jgi:hypothetical protein